MDYRKVIDQASVVSFDVFDTLIHRVVLQPVDVFELLANRLGATEIGLYHPTLASSFAKLRREAESRARIQHHAIYGSHEITLEDIYHILKDIVHADEKVIEQIMEEEFLLEQIVVYADPLMKILYEYAVQQNKTVILCSDMYLSSEQISVLLNKAGYQPPFQLYVSGELKQSKHEGSMYGLVCERLGINVNQLVHFGDNKHADYDIPRRLGVSSQLFNAFGPASQPKHLSSHKDYSVFTTIQGCLQKIVMDQNIPHDPWFDIGVRIFGPLFLGKFLWLITNLRQQPVDKVLFFARDAHFFHQLYERYQHAFGVSAPSEYVYFSRAVLLIPSFTDLVPERVWHLFSGRYARTVKEHLRKLDIDSTVVHKAIKEAGFFSDEDVVHYSDRKMHQLLLRLYPLLMKTAKHRRETVIKYIHQVVGKNSRLAVVDIGWTGNMQGSVSRLLQLCRNDAEIDGYYFGTFESVAWNYLPRNRYKAYLVNESKPLHYTHMLQTGGVELLEFALMAPHGTTLGYRQQGERIEPVLEQNEVDEEMQALALRVQSGAMKFIETVIPLILHIGSEHMLSSEWAEPFFRLIDNPTLEEAELLGGVTHSDSASDTSRRLPLAQKLDVKARRREENYRQAHADAFWKKAFELLNA